MKFNPIFGLSLILAVTACGGRKPTPSEAAPTQNNTATALGVEGYTVQPNYLEYTIEATGNLIAYEAVQIRPERSGKVVDLSFQEASFVPQNKIIARIDDQELKAQKRRLEINLDLAKKEVARGNELLTIQGISEEEVDRLINRVEDLQAEINILNIQIEKSLVKAPFSGLIGLRQISQGAFVTSNDIIAELRQINPIKLEFDVPEKFLNQVKEGQVLSFTTVGSDQTYSAEVYAISTEIASGTRTFKVRARSQNPDSALRPGQFAKVTLVTGTNDQAIIVPTDAVIPILNGKQVFVAKNGKAVATNVETGDRVNEGIEITSGLKIGDTVILTGLLTLVDGMPIQVRNNQ